MIFFTLKLINQLQWAIAVILLGDSFDRYELADLWEALCDGNDDGVKRVQADIAYQLEQAAIDDRHNDNDYDCCGYYPYRDD